MLSVTRRPRWLVQEYAITKEQVAEHTRYLHTTPTFLYDAVCIVYCCWKLLEVENRTGVDVVEDEEIWYEGGMRLDGSEGGLWSGAFVPPPPRPVFLDESASPDGLTTCDLCSWAWQGQRHRPFHLPAPTTEVPVQLGWMLTLVIVSIISAAIGAVVMIVVLHCKSRMKKSTTSTVNGNGTSGDDKDSSPGVSVENHYTHMACEALYAELERAAGGPAYQNSAYADGDASAPSSAYYSDLSGPERAYEEVGLSSWPPPLPQPMPPIRERETLSSNYV